MPSQVQFRRGSKAQNDSFSGAAGEIVVNNTNQSIRIHDGTTQGGFELAKVDLTNVSSVTNLSLSGITTTNSLSIGSTQVISSARQLQNIVSLDATTTATIESAVAAAPNDFTSLNISGLSTFSGITTHTTSLFGTQASFSGVITATTFVGALTGNATTATTATTANVLNTSNSYQVSALGIGQAAGSGTELDLAGRYAQTSIAVAELDIDCSLGNYYTKTISSSSTFTFSNIPASRSYSFTLCITHDSGTITWPASVKWPQNTAPVLTTYRTHKFMFSTYNNGSVWYGAALPNYSY